MTDFGMPNISVGNKSNEQNMQIVKAWAIETSEKLNYQFAQLEATIEALSEEVASLKEEQ